ncbi:unnamed protein product [Sphenostylis stenocarpa]|uniref:Uncharacterized protein n=1 Tax=Sphenostylis stenocarpa TaxID=92480 RepID=A0AA86T9Y7_9FABA|nr:unnamed protein product [Sphenostylis stenocarpa]
MCSDSEEKRRRCGVALVGPRKERNRNPRNRISDVSSWTGFERLGRVRVKNKRVLALIFVYLYTHARFFSDSHVIVMCGLKKQGPLICTEMKEYVFHALDEELGCV